MGFKTATSTLALIGIVTLAHLPHRHLRSSLTRIPLLDPSFPRHGLTGRIFSRMTNLGPS